MTFLYLKALHLVFIVTWFSGLFYIVRLFIYHTEAAEKSEPERSILINQYKLMSKRLWVGITWPSAVLTLIFGGSLLSYYQDGIPGWLWAKLGFVLGLYIYHFFCHRIYQNLQNDHVKYKSQKLRIWNELATIFLISIIFLVILRSALGLLWGVAGLTLFTAVLLLAINVYKKVRNKSSDR
jgi:protoporphyrinogen IX oxidase